MGRDGGDGDEARSAAMLQAISDAAVECIILHARGTIVSVNPAGAAMFGYTPEELVGRSVLEFTAPSSRDAVRNSYEGEQVELYEAVGLRRDGSQFRAEMRSRNVAYGNDTLRATVLRDLSERDESERERLTSISLLRATIDSTTDGILVVDRNDHITLYNEQFRQMWGLPEKLLFQRIDGDAVAAVEHQLLHPETFRARIAELYATPELETMDTLEFRDGRVVERYTRPQRVGSEIVGRVWSFRDVTAQRHAARTLELAVQMRDEFLGIASHELFTPITSLGVAIRGLRGLDHVAGGAAVTEQHRERLFRNAERQVKRLARLVQELLDVTRIDGGKLALSIDEVDLRDVAREALERFAPELERDKLVVTLDAPESVVGSWDRTRLEQVVTNLLSNAMKFGRGRPIEVIVRQNGARAELTVRDHGLGIAADQQALIFERFRRAVSSRHFAGLGLGLYITRQIVEAHGGVLRLTSTPGEGSTFTADLPRAAPIEGTSP